MNILSPVLHKVASEAAISRKKLLGNTAGYLYHTGPGHSGFPVRQPPKYRASHLWRALMLPGSLLEKSSQLKRREFLISACVVAVGFASAPIHSQPIARKKILFICQFGTAKSAIAREFFRKYALNRGIDVQAISRGITIEDHISDGLRKKLAADGINPNAEPIRVLTQEDWQSADILINFNPLPKDILHADIRDWSDLPSVNEQYRKSRSVLKRRINALLDEIERS
jgi:arsenate reductase (thioredoxin)